MVICTFNQSTHPPTHALPTARAGYPKVNTVDPTGRYFAFFDFANLHVIDLSTFKALDAGGAFIGAPRAVGFPVWVDA